MRMVVQAACGCSIGNVRKNNEDNFFFDAHYLERENAGLNKPVSLEVPLKNGLHMAVFDGMGGESYGEYAAFAAVRQMYVARKTLADLFISRQTYLKELVTLLNGAVNRVQEEMHTERIGTTLVSLYFWRHRVYACNVGDSRAYRLRNGEFLQLSKDHIERRPGSRHHKGVLTQFLGFGTEEMLLNPHIFEGEIQIGDVFLLCSDGLTDMLTDLEISGIMQKHTNAESCVQELLNTALEHGGRDNVTVIVCRLI